jgi:predicted TIM-barrel fold metal-dependent hydrolase
VAHGAGRGATGTVRAGELPARRAVDPDGTGYRVVDVHQHLSDDADDDRADACARRRFMDRFGIDAAFLLPPVLGSARASADRLNERVASYCEIDRERFPVGIGTVELGASERATLGQVRRAGELGLQGIAWHHLFLGEFLDSPATVRAVEVCCAAGVDVFFVHVVASSLLEAPWRLSRLCGHFPDVTFVVLDGLSSPHHGQGMIELARSHRNVVLDTAVLSSYGNLVERFVEANGDDRLVFGSDYAVVPKPFCFPYSLAEILHSDLPTASKARILSDNASGIARPAAP